MKADAQEHLTRADQLLELEEAIAEMGFPADAIGRAYYAMLHAARAVLLELGVERSSHHGVWAAFGEYVAAPGLMDARHHRAGIQLFRARGESDYVATPTDTREDAGEAIEIARNFAAACRTFLQSR
jgi:uncharacterized protein (UPF0332 family)